MKVKNLSIFIAVCLLTTLVSCKETLPPVEEEKVFNTVYDRSFGHITDDNLEGYHLEKEMVDGEEYISIVSENRNAIYKTNIEPLFFELITKVDNEIYFVCGSDYLAVDVEGKQVRSFLKPKGIEINSNFADFPLIYKDRIYNESVYDGTLVVSDLNGKRIGKVAYDFEHCALLGFYNDKIYFAGEDDPEYGCTTIESYDLNTKKHETLLYDNKLWNDGLTARFDGNYMYFIAYNRKTKEEGLCRMDLNTKETEFVLQASVWDFVMSEDSFYYISGDGKKGPYLYRANKDGSNLQKVVDFKVKELYKSNDYLYFVEYKKGDFDYGHMYRIKTNGENLEKLCDEVYAY